MTDPIGFQDGIEATRQRLNAVDPGKAGYDKLLGEPGKDYGRGPVEGTVEKLKDGHNEVWKAGGLADRVAALEAHPFP